MEQSLQNEEQITNKDKILELRKAQMYKKWHTDENIKRIKRSKKPFPKYGIILIIYSIISMAVVEYGPWMYLKTTYVSGIEVDGFIYKNLRVEDPNLLTYLIEPFNNFHGMFKQFFYDIPAIISYALVILFLFGLIITIFGLIDRKKNYDVKKFREKQSYLYLFTIPPCILIITSCIPFISSYLLGGHNAGGEGSLENLLKNIAGIDSLPMWTPPAPYFLIILTFFIITITFTILDSNLRIIMDEMKTNKEKMIEKTRIIPKIKKFKE